MRDTDRASLIPTPGLPVRVGGRRREMAGAEGGDSDSGRGGQRDADRDADPAAVARGRPAIADRGSAGVPSPSEGGSGG